MANVEDALKEYDIVNEPEQPQHDADTNIHVGTPKHPSIPPDKTDSFSGKREVEKKNCPTSRDRLPSADMICPRVNCPEKIVS